MGHGIVPDWENFASSRGAGRVHHQQVVNFSSQLNEHVSTSCQHCPHSTTSQHYIDLQEVVMFVPQLNYSKSTLYQQLTHSTSSPHSAHYQEVVILIPQFSDLVSTISPHAANKVHILEGKMCSQRH